MRTGTCLTVRWWWRHPLPFVALIAIACERAPDTVLGPSAHLQAGAALEDGQFYYYRGQPVYLDVDPQMITVATAEHDPRSSIGEALRAEGFTPGPLAAMANRRDHWEVQLPGNSPTAARALVARLRASRRFAFVENTFRLRGHAETRLRLVNRVAVQFKPGVSRSSIDSLAQAVGLRLLEPANTDAARWSYIFAYPENEAPLRVAQRLDRNPLVEWADPVMHGGWARLDVPTDPFYSLQYHLKNTESLNGHAVDINIEPAWTATKGASTVRVAVLDDGVDASHPDLQCNMASAEGADMYEDHIPPYADDEWHPNLEH